MREVSSETGLNAEYDGTDPFRDGTACRRLFRMSFVDLLFSMGQYWSRENFINTKNRKFARDSSIRTYLSETSKIAFPGKSFIQLQV